MLLNEIEIHFHLGDGPVRPFLVSFLLSLLLMSLLSTAQEKPSLAPPADTPSIQDNSFLIEEAYNQEDGVIQHINSFLWTSQGHGWVYTETDEWPLRSLKHQLSLTLSAIHSGDFPGSGAGWGDSALNYRYQLLGNGNAKIAMAPRLTLWLPTGQSSLGRGFGSLGLQTNLPVSIQHSRRLVTHWNAGATWLPHARNELGDSASAVATNLGQSIVWLAKPRVNFLVETVWIADERVVASKKTQWAHHLLVNPGIRWAYNFRNGLQIVPGDLCPYRDRPQCWRKRRDFLSQFRASLRTGALQVTMRRGDSRVSMEFRAWGSDLPQLFFDLFDSNDL